MDRKSKIYSELMNLKKLNDRFRHSGPEWIIEYIIRELSPNLAMTTSFQVSGTVLIHMIKAITPDLPLVFIDTGYHFPETLNFRDNMVKLFDLNLQTIHPEISNEEFEKTYGAFVYKENPNLCCQIHKVGPQKRFMKESGIQYWISGLRKDQGTSRANHEIFMIDKEGYIRIHPLIHWDWGRIWEYIRRHNLPYNPLYNQGYTSIGCARCTTKNTITNGERYGRWKHSQKVECGLHDVLIEHNSKLVSEMYYE